MANLIEDVEKTQKAMDDIFISGDPWKAYWFLRNDEALKRIMAYPKEKLGEEGCL